MRTLYACQAELHDTAGIAEPAALMLGRRPTASRPDARAVWDHACLQADHYLARRLHRLDDEALAELDARQQAILDNPPSFDPSELERAASALTPPERHQIHVQGLPVPSNFATSDSNGQRRHTTTGHAQPPAPVQPGVRSPSNNSAGGAS